MKLIQKMKIWKELRRLEARVHDSPSPSTFVDLGQVYINLGMHDRTLELADEGLALFPNSGELRKLRRFAQKHQITNRVTEIRVRLRKSATPKLYRELASHYLELGDFDAVQSTCQECIRRFPEHDGAYLVVARAYLTNFYRDLIASDGIEAVRNLQKATALAPNNCQAHKLLAEVLYRIGATGQALSHLEVLRAHGSRDPEVDAMHQVAAAKPPADELDPDAMFHEVEARGSLSAAPGAETDALEVEPREDEASGSEGDSEE